MTSYSYIPNGDTDRVVWLNNFATKLALYINALGLTSADLLNAQKDSAMFAYIVHLTDIYKQTVQNAVAHKNILSHVKVPNTQLGPIPGVPAPGTPPAAVPAGIFDRISALVTRIKTLPAYNEAMGQDLNIIAASQTIDINNIQPALKIKLDAGRPHIKCQRGPADAIDLYVDRKDGSGFVLIGRLLKMDYIDVASLPANTLLAEWDYKARYVIGNDPVGLFSLVESILVKKM